MSRKISGGTAVFVLLAAGFVFLAVVAEMTAQTEKHRHLEAMKAIKHGVGVAPITSLEAQ